MSVVERDLGAGGKPVLIVTRGSSALTRVPGDPRSRGSPRGSRCLAGREAISPPAQLAPGMRVERSGGCTQDRRSCLSKAACHMSIHGYRPPVLKDTAVLPRRVLRTHPPRGVEVPVNLEAPGTGTHSPGHLRLSFS